MKSVSNNWTGLPVILSLENYDTLLLPIDLNDLVNNWKISFVPDASQAGTYEFELVAQDLAGGEARQKFRVQVADVDLNDMSALISSIPPPKVYVGQSLDYQMDINLANTFGYLQFELLQAPSGLHLDRAGWTHFLDAGI